MLVIISSYGLLYIYICIPSGKREKTACIVVYCILFPQEAQKRLLMTRIVLPELQEAEKSSLVANFDGRFGSRRLARVRLISKNASSDATFNYRFFLLLVYKFFLSSIMMEIEINRRREQFKDEKFLSV